MKHASIGTLLNIFEDFLGATETKNRRRSPRLDERLKPCQCCNYPISERHHLFQFSKHGDKGHVLHLCPNCHDIYHITEAKVIGKPGPKTEACFDKLLEYETLTDRVVWCLFYIDQVHKTNFYQRIQERSARRNEEGAA